MTRAVWTTFAIIALCLLIADAAAARARFDNWSTVTNARQGFENADHQSLVKAVATYTPGAGRTGFCD